MRDTNKLFFDSYMDYKMKKRLREKYQPIIKSGFYNTDKVIGEIANKLINRGILK